MSDAQGFDYGSEEVVEAGGNFKNPTEGDHSARLRSIIHLGMFRETYNNEVKKPAPQVAAIFELKDDEDFEDDGVTPLTLTKTFPLKKGDKAFCTKFIKALDPKGKLKGFDDMISIACQVNCKGGKEKNDDGTPKYINFGGLSGLPAKFANMIDPLVVEGVGHCRFDDLTEEAILELHSIREVAYIMMKGGQYEGSVAQELVNKIREDNPEFAKIKAKKTDSGSSDEKSEPDAKVQSDVKTDLKEEEEF